MNNEFFKITDIFPPLASGIEGKIYSEPMVECSADRSHRRGGRDLPPFHIAINTSVRDDFLWDYLSRCYVSNRVVDLMHKNGVGSFVTRPVFIYEKQSGSPIQNHTYHELIVTGWGGIAPEESGVKLIKKCDYCKLLKYSGYTHPEKLVNPTQWDGSDLFMVWPMPKYRFITKKLKELFEANNVSGLRYIPLSELKVRDTMQLGPCRLSDWMPLDRAKALGDKYDIT